MTRSFTRSNFLLGLIAVALIIAAIVLSLLLLSGTGTAAESTAVNQSEAMRSSSVGEGVYVVGVVVRDSAGSETVIYMEQAGSTPTSTPTVTPPSTNTPRPTATATASYTPLPATATQTPTATESAQPTMPPSTSCGGTVKAASLRLRESPVTGAEITRLSTGERVTISQVQYFDQTPQRVDEWVKITASGNRAGWAAAYFDNQEYITYDATQACMDVRFPEPALAFHGVPGANGGEMQVAFGVLKSAGIPFGVKPVNEPALCRDTVAMGGLCIYRSVHPSDCPNVDAADPKAEALRYMSALAPYVNQNTHANYIELVNECPADATYLARFWNDFMLEAIRLGKLWGWPPLILPTWNPGMPDDWTLDLIRPALVALRDSGGAIGLHAYSIYPGTGLCDSDDWLGYRHQRVHRKLVETGLGDLRIAITEAARVGGGETVSISDFTCWYNNVRHDRYLLMVALWTAGQTDAWPQANLNGSMIPLAHAIVG